MPAAPRAAGVPSPRDRPRRRLPAAAPLAPELLARASVFPRDKPVPVPDVPGPPARNGRRHLPIAFAAAGLQEPDVISKREARSFVLSTSHGGDFYNAPNSRPRMLGAQLLRRDEQLAVPTPDPL